MPTPDPLIDIAARHGVYLEGVKTTHANLFDDFLRAMQKDILAQLANVDDMDSLKGRRLTRLLSAVRKTLDAGFGEYYAVWLKEMEALAEYESGFEVRSLNKVANYDFTLPAPQQVITAAFSKPLSVTGVDRGSLLESFFKGWTEKTYRRVEGAIRMSAAQGESLPQLIRRLRGTRKAKYADGLFHASKRDIALMARTATHHVATQAREAVWRANSKVIKRVEFIAVLDSSTSALCRGLSGKTFKVDEGPRPPLHMACRSMVVPVLSGKLALLDEGGTQFSRGAKGIKNVPADMDYYDWLKTQPVGFQDSVLGPTRGKLLRKGGLSATRFRDLQLDKKFKERTLDQLRELEPLAFEKAGI